MGRFVSAGCRQFDVVVMPFPFVERERKRPAVVISSDAAIGETGVAILAMITRLDAAPWHGDLPIADVVAAGLNKPSKARMKLHTIAAADLDRPIGRLAENDRDCLRAGLRELFAL